MHNSVTFQHPAEFVSALEDNGILATGAAGWFVALLGRVDGLLVQSELCQEDWGVVVFAERASKRFWIGLSGGPRDEPGWLAHFHHHSFAWLQRWSTAGRHELRRLVDDFHVVLVGEQAVRNVAWYDESDLNKADAPCSVTPHATG